MGRVYEVEHLELGKRFVIKSLHPDLNDRDDLVERLRTEWVSLGKLNHPNIVDVTDAGTSNGVAYFVMEKLEGQNLATLLRDQGAVPEPDALGIAVDILRALAAAHATGVVHRDVKPANVHISRNGSAKLLDFGIAKRVSRRTSITARGIAIGTPRYMSPEQACGESVDARSDIYAVGLVLYEMLAGRGPFDHLKGGAELVRAQIEESPGPLSVVAPDVGSDVAHWCQRMLAKEPAERPERAADLAMRLEGLVDPVIPHGVHGGSSADLVGELSDTVAGPEHRRPGASSVALPPPVQTRTSWRNAFPRNRSGVNDRLGPATARLLRLPSDGASRRRLLTLLLATAALTGAALGGWGALSERPLAPPTPARPPGVVNSSYEFPPAGPPPAAGRTKSAPETSPLSFGGGESPTTLPMPAHGKREPATLGGAPQPMKKSKAKDARPVVKEPRGLPVPVHVEQALQDGGLPKSGL